MKTSETLISIALAFTAGITVGAIYAGQGTSDAAPYIARIQRLQKSIASHDKNERKFQKRQHELAELKDENEKRIARLQRDIAKIHARRVSLRNEIDRFGEINNEKSFSASTGERDLLGRLDSLLGGSGATGKEGRAG